MPAKTLIKRFKVSMGERGYIPYGTNKKLDRLVDSIRPFDRLRAVERNYGIDKLINDDNPFVREKIAKKGHNLLAYVHDSDSRVRQAVARQGVGLDILQWDEDERVANVAFAKMVAQVDADVVGQWIKENPEKCASIDNRAITLSDSCVESIGLYDCDVISNKYSEEEIYNYTVKPNPELVEKTDLFRKYLGYPDWHTGSASSQAWYYFCLRFDLNENNPIRLYAICENGIYDHGREFEIKLSNKQCIELIDKAIDVADLERKDILYAKYMKNWLVDRGIIERSDSLTGYVKNYILSYLNTEDLSGFQDNLHDVVCSDTTTLSDIGYDNIYSVFADNNGIDGSLFVCFDEFCENELKELHEHKQISYDPIERNKKINKSKQETYVAKVAKVI